MSPSQLIARRLSQPMQPQPTGVKPRLHRLRGIRAVLFDVYGTLLVSGSGDLGTADEGRPATALAEALDDMGIMLRCSPGEAAAAFRQAIAAEHDRAKQDGIDFPEVDLIEVWRQVIGQRIKETFRNGATGQLDVSLLAASFEARANPTWPMPGLEACLSCLRQQGILLGLISNAQFFTAELFPALLGKTLDELGFDATLCYYSYLHRRAKPSEYMFRLACKHLTSRGIQPMDVLYVGNDMRNDILPATCVGFRAALFAGDARSLRLREGDPAVAGLNPDAIVTELVQIADIVGH